jgi:hypothetical protein
MQVTHSEKFPGTFASHHGDHLQSAGATRPAPQGGAFDGDPWAPSKAQAMCRRAAFASSGFAGNSAPDHVDQLHSLAEYLRHW